MSEYNLTPSARRIARELVDASAATGSDTFSYRTTFSFRGAEFGTQVPRQVKMEPAELNLLVNSNLVSYRPTNPLGGDGTVLPAAFDAIKNNFQLPDPLPSLSIESVGNMLVGNVDATDHFNFTVRQQQLMTQIIAASHDRNQEHFWIDRRGGSFFLVFPPREGQPNTDFHAIDVSMPDVAAFAAQGFIQMADGHHGCLLKRAYDAVSSGFPSTPPAVSMVNQNISNIATGGGSFQVVGQGNNQITTTSGNDDVMMVQLAGTIAELLGAMRVMLSAEQADAATRDAQDVQAELQKESPDPITVASRVQSLVNRMTAWPGRGIEWLDKAGKGAEAFEKVSPFLKVMWAITKKNWELILNQTISDVNLLSKKLSRFEGSR